MHDTGRKPQFHCDVCNKAFFSDRGLMAHIKIHTLPEDNFCCDLCGKWFKLLRYLKWHMKRHSSHRLKCKVCYKEFVTRAEIQRHMFIHTGETPFSCPLCKRSFNSYANMVRHERYFHSEVRDIKCEICCRKFKSYSHLNRHKKSKLHKCKSAELLH